MTLFLVAFLALASSAAPPPAGETTPDASPDTTTSLVAETEHFALHSHPWVNLHLLLREWARRDAEDEKQRPGYPLPERDRLSDLPTADRAAWRSALDTYTKRVLPRKYLFDDSLRTLRARLGAHPPGAETAPADLPVDVEDALNAAMPIFRAHWWTEHDAGNRAWIATADSLLRRHEAALAPQVAHAYGGTWPDAPVRVDVAAVSNWTGAYSSDGHVFIGHRAEQEDPREPLESLMHEAAHVPGLEQPLRRQLRQAFETEGVELPGRLWHAVIFYTSGALTRRVMASDYAPYAVTRNMWSRVYDGVKSLLEAHWRPFLYGDTDDRTAAFRRVARALAKAREEAKR